VNGHDLSALKTAILSPAEGEPKTIVANTVKGKGCRTLENNTFEWHRRSPNAEELKMLLGEVNETSI
jgi:transketolase